MALRWAQRGPSSHGQGQARSEGLEPELQGKPAAQGSAKVLVGVDQPAVRHLRRRKVQPIPIRAGKVAGEAKRCRDERVCLDELDLETSEVGQKCLRLWLSLADAWGTRPGGSKEGARKLVDDLKGSR
jgi:hypothetical protein